MENSNTEKSNGPDIPAAQEPSQINPQVAEEILQTLREEEHAIHE